PLRELAAADSRGPLQLQAVAASRGLEVYGKMVKVVIFFKSPSAADRAAIRALGVRPQIRRDRRLQALVSVASLSKLAALPEVAMVRPPGYPVPVQVPPRGVPVTEAWQLINASAFDLASPPIYGAGVTVTVVDQGFIDYTVRQTENNLPPDPDTTYTEFAANPVPFTAHGTAVAEIVHDLAPGAMINLYRGITDMEIEQATTAVGSSGVDIAVMSLGFLEGPFDGSSPLAQAVTQAASKGVFFAVASGNFAQRHWEGWFRDADQDGLNEFSPADEGINLNVTTGTVNAFLSWWRTGSPLTAQDYDLVLVDAGGVEVARSAFTQDGDDPPQERLFAVVPNGPYELRVEAVNINTALQDFLELYVRDVDLESSLQVTSSSLSVPGDAPGAVTVGATRGVAGLPDGLTIDSLEPFSSQGPTDDGRLKPELVAPDAVSTASGTVDPTLAPFFGTSAAAPHVAGAAALLKSEDPGRTSNDLLVLLQRLAIDMGPPGWDNQFGEGRIELRVGVTAPPPADQIPPVISIIQPTPGALLGTRRPRIVASLDDEESGIDPASIDLKIDGIPQVVPPSSFDPLAEILDFTVASDLSLGAHVVTLTAADNDGNQGNTATVGFRIALPIIDAGLHMVSLPLTQLVDPDPIAIFGLPLTDIALARWLPEDTALNKYHVFPDPFASFEPPDAEPGYSLGQTVPSPPAGLGYFLRLTNAVTLELGQLGQPPDASQPYVIKLRRGTTNPKGWNLIGTPFNAPIELATVEFVVDGVPMSLGQVIDEGFTTGILFTLVPDPGGGGHYEFTDPATGRLEPLKGYWIQVRLPRHAVFERAEAYAARDSGLAHQTVGTGCWTQGPRELRGRVRRGG
ncbi:MAG: S8 family serine peptidase, partial [Armatimonadota bacterium]